MWAAVPVSGDAVAEVAGITGRSSPAPEWWGHRVPHQSDRKREPFEASIEFGSVGGPTLNERTRRGEQSRVGPATGSSTVAVAGGIETPVDTREPYRWGGRAAHCACLESRCPRGLLGSNPSPTAFASNTPRRPPGPPGIRRRRVTANERSEQNNTSCDLPPERRGFRLELSARGGFVTGKPDRPYLGTFCSMVARIRSLEETLSLRSWP